MSATSTDSNKNSDDDNNAEGDQETPCIRLFISGDRSQVGKSSVCMGLLGSFLQLGYKPQSLAYIKPATQCEATQLVTTFCDQHAIEYLPSPIVYYQGFTREFLAGRVSETSSQMLQRVSETVDTLARKKRILIIDGVGYPAVGSICGTSNAHIAMACGYPTTVASIIRKAAPVLLVGKSGVGDAVDSFNLNATYFEFHNVQVIGAIFNRLSLEGFYSLENCKSTVEKYFQQEEGKQAFGFVPEVLHLSEDSTTALQKANAFVFTFMKHVNVLKIISAAKKCQRDAASFAASCSTCTCSSSKNNAVLLSEKSELHTQRNFRQRDTVQFDGNNTSTTFKSGSSRDPLTREQIEAAARAAGAKAG